MNAAVDSQLLTTDLIAVAETIGFANADAQLLADAIVAAELRGIPSHGLLRFPMYIRGVAAGEINPRPEIDVLYSRAATESWDADSGLGVVIGQRAMQRAVELADRSGVGVVTVRNSSHSGALAVHVMRAAEAGMIGHFTSNAPALMAPYGGKEALLSNSPFAYAIPSGGSPIILDMACSVAARGRIRTASKIGEPIPEGWAVDQNGRPTTDPSAAMLGVVLPFGGHKGSGLAVIYEILAAAVPGALLSLDVPKLFLSESADTLDLWRIGHMAMALDPAAFGSRETFVGTVDRLVDALRSSEPADGFDRVLVPGDREATLTALHRREGIRIDSDVWADFTQMCTDSGINQTTQPGR